MDFIKKLFRKKKTINMDQVTWKNLSDVYANATIEENPTELSFLQGNLGNCGMISAMAALITNRQLLNKVVPKGQSFESCSQLPRKQFEFNLYKRGKPCRVSVSESLPFYQNHLLYSQSVKAGECLSPLLEKALVQLLFEGKYEKARSVAAVKVFTSFTNTFFEQIIKYGNNCNIHGLNDIINHGVRTKSLMAVTFKKDMNKTLLAKHYYTLIDINEKFVEIYNPHGRTICVPKTIFFDYLFLFEISYSENKLLMWPEVKTFEEFSESWIALKGSNVLFMIYELKKLIQTL